MQGVPVRLSRAWLGGETKGLGRQLAEGWKAEGRTEEGQTRWNGR